MNDFRVTTQLSQEEYCKLFLRLSYKQRLYQIMTMMGIFLLILSIVRFFIKSFISSGTQMFLLAFSIYCLLLFPLIVWLRARKIYRTNKGLQGPIQYSFSNDGLSLDASGVTSTFEWKIFGKTTQTKKYLLLFGYNRAAYFLKLKDLTPEQIDFIKGKIND